MSTYTDRDGDTFRVRLPEDDLLDLVVNGDTVAMFYREDAAEIVKLIEEATK